jgi:exopolysaccharide production protein ExoZ
VPRLHAIQVLRALAAAMIVVHHGQADAAMLGLTTSSLLAPLEDFPWTAGVDIFFVISGFIMVHASRDLFGRSGAAWIFLSGRLTRIVPLYWAATSLYCCAVLLAPDALNSDAPTLRQILASYLFWPAERPDGLVQPVFSLGWTLNYEMFFYVLFALAIVMPRRRAVASLAVALSAFVALGALFSLPVAPTFWTRPIILEFALGMGIGVARYENWLLPNVVRLLLVVFAIIWLAAYPVTPSTQIDWHVLVSNGVPAVSLVAAAALGRPRQRPEAGAERAMVVIGDASYALYLSHPFVIRALHQAVVVTGLGTAFGYWGFMALCMALTVVASIAIHLYFERPATRQARTLLGQRGGSFARISWRNLPPPGKGSGPGAR